MGYVDLSADVSYISTNGGIVGKCLSNTDTNTNTTKSNSNSFSSKDLDYKSSPTVNGFDRTRFINAIKAYKHKNDDNSISNTGTNNSKDRSDDTDFNDDFWANDDNHVMDDDYKYEGTCFEVADMYKGDLARTYFYLSTAYLREWTCCNDIGVDASFIKPWMESEMRLWHVADPVDSYEIARNNQIYSDYQHNRNPYIDYPELVDSIEDF